MKPQVLFINSLESDYLQDTVYAGLVEILGLENVFETPRNRFFHHPFREYPRNLGVHDRGFWKGMLRWQPKKFDLVVVGSAKPATFWRYLHLLPKISSNTPVVFLDGGDRPALGGDLQRLGHGDLFIQAEKMRPFDRIFKREYLVTESYSERVIPMQFALNSHRLPVSVPKERSYDVTFWAVESDAIRTQALTLLEGKFDCAANGTIRNQIFKNYKRKGSFYLEELARSKVTLNFRGVGWDTLRYWEVPALGGFMISQKPRIVIPNNFRDGKEVVYCRDDLRDLLDLCEYYLKNPEQREKIAAAAGEWSKAHHSHIHRAQAVLNSLGLSQ